MASSNTALPEPWLRGTLTDIPAVPRAVLHALELAQEDVTRFCGGLSEAELNTRLFGLPSVGFHLRHIARSIDRLLTYAEGRLLSEEQTAALKSELHGTSTKEDVFSELGKAISDAEKRIRAIDVNTFQEMRSVGRKQLPTTVGGLLVHVADHTQRHVGQAITTSKLVIAQR